MDICAHWNQELLVNEVSPLWDLRVTECVQDVDGDGLLYSVIGYYNGGLIYSDINYLTVSFMVLNLSFMFPTAVSPSSVLIVHVPL